jgi:hypothetical protein
MKSAVTILMAMALSVAARVPASAQVALSPVVRHTSPVGLWIVGGTMLGAASVIARSGVVSAREKRELAAREAHEAALFPFMWVFFKVCDPGTPYEYVTTIDQPCAIATSSPIGG